MPFALAGTSPASAQDRTDEGIKLFRKDLRSLRKQIIAANMDLSDKEAEEFWPVFERYTQELAAKQDEKYALLKQPLGWHKWGWPGSIQESDSQNFY